MQIPGAPIRYFYAPISAYAYLGEPRLIEIARQAGNRVQFMPIDIMPVFAAAEVTAPARQSRERVAYRRADLVRIAARLGMRLNPVPAYWPVPMALAARVIIAAELSGVDQHPVSMAIMTAIQADERDISSPEALRTALSARHLPATELLDVAQGDETARLLDENIRAAIALPVLGAPTYVVGSEIFFGQDRLTDLQWWLENRTPR